MPLVLISTVRPWHLPAVPAAAVVCEMVIVYEVLLVLSIH